MAGLEGLTRARALGASPHASGVPVGLLASPTLTKPRWLAALGASHSACGSPISAALRRSAGD